jgi:hypothetical protein
MRKQIQETAEHRADTEKRIMEHNLEIRRLEEAERSLSRNFENRAKPLAVSEARYNLRRRRSTREDCHDEVEDALLREVMELQAGVADMQVGGLKPHAHPPPMERAWLRTITLYSERLETLLWRACSPHSPFSFFRSVALRLPHALLPCGIGPGRCVCWGDHDRPHQAWDD